MLMKRVFQKHMASNISWFLLLTRKKQDNSFVPLSLSKTGSTWWTQLMTMKKKHTILGIVGLVKVLSSLLYE
jgi:hypothetical protein